MILKLNGADFSANNIGKLIIWNAFTKKIFQHYTRYSLGSEQSIAVNDFINVLDKQGVLKHLGFFNAPWLASSVNEAIYDVVNDYQLDNTDSGWTMDSVGSLTAPSESQTKILMKSSVPTKNFYLDIRYSASAYSSPSVSRSEGDCIVDFTYDSSGLIGGCIYKNRNWNKGYKPSNPTAVILFEVKKTTVTDNSEWGSTDALAYNNEALVAGTDTTFTSVADTVDSLEAWIVTGVPYIFAMGDGTLSLSDTQRTEILAAMQTLQTTLKSLG